MAITSADIQNQSFAIDRKGYDVDEVDVFLEHVADEIDGLNATIAELEAKVAEYEERIEELVAESAVGEVDETVAAAEVEAEDEPVSIWGEPAVVAPAEPAVEAEPAVDSLALADAEARIAELEAALAEKQADDKAISNALIVAQRSADEVLESAHVRADEILADAQAQAASIVEDARAEREQVWEEISTLEDSRDETRRGYKEMLKDIVTDANQKIASLESAARAQSAHARSPYVNESRYSRKEAAPAAAPAAVAPAAEAAEPAAQPAVVQPRVTPMPSSVEKDLSGFGATDDDFGFDDLD